jgi:hypothetical protein
MAIATWIAVLLVAVAAGEAALIHYLYHTRTIHLGSMLPAQMELKLIEITPTSNFYVVHAFPHEDAPSCDGFNTICYTQI